MIDRWQRALSIAVDNQPADLILANASVVNVFNGEITQGNVAVSDGRIVGIGDYGEAEEVVDIQGAYLCPSFIDGHIHTESSLLWLPEFARAVVPRGTGGIVTDPHEIVNVAGMPGFAAMVTASRNLPIDIRFTVPSCVPASPNESSGAIISPEDIAIGLDIPETVGLGEMMNFPGVLSGDERIYRMLETTVLHRLRADGHAPGLTGRSLDAYILSGMTSDHEATELVEASEKLARGMMVMLREGSSTKNMLDLLPLVTDATYPHCCFASDDRDCAMLLQQGHLDETLRIAVGAGLDPIHAIQLATINVANYWRLGRIGAVAPGYQANLTVLQDLEQFEVLQVYFNGRLVAKDGQALFDTEIDIPDVLLNTMHVAPLGVSDLRLDPAESQRAVGVIDSQIVTRLLNVQTVVRDGEAVTSVEDDLLKLVTVERHHATGNVGVGYVQGFGLKRGALASSIAHDAHNIIAVGVDDPDIFLAVDTVAQLQGGLVAVAGGEIIAQMPLPVAGILSDRPLVETADLYESMEKAAHGLGSHLISPFGLLAFLALSVIPEARVTDQGFITLV